LPVDLTIRYKNFLKDELLHTNPLECHFVDCVVIGAVDYIFGSAFALFKHCHIISIGKGYIVAPSTYENQDYGFVFYECKIENKADTSEVFLARPWREFGSCIFINCDFLGDFHPERYNDWDKSNYRFGEHPYVKSSLSKKIPSTYLEQLKIKVEEIC
jgi:pectin methylesterase-like acyl-CoA thioesterase